jgi:hypothetical protein
MRPAGVVDIRAKRRLDRLGLASSHLSYLTFQI